MRDVVFAALLIRPRPRLSALSRGEPIVSVGRAHRAPAARRPVDMYRSSRWGAPRLRAAALSSLPACAPSPLAGRNLPPLFHAPAARPRPIALTLNPPGFVLPLVALAPPRFSSARASLIPRFPSLAGLRCASPLRKRLPSPLWASLRSAHATQARVRGICQGFLVHDVPARRGGKPCGMSVPVILCLTAFARLGATGRGHIMPKKGRTCVLCCLAVAIQLRFAKCARVDRLHIAYSSQYQCEDLYLQVVHELLRA